MPNAGLHDMPEYSGHDRSCVESQGMACGRVREFNNIQFESGTLDGWKPDNFKLQQEDVFGQER